LVLDKNSIPPVAVVQIYIEYQSFSLHVTCQELITF